MSNPKNALIPKDLLTLIYEFLNDDVACLSCTSRQRTMDEETWEHAMYLRDRIDMETAWEPVSNEESDQEKK